MVGFNAGWQVAFERGGDIWISGADGRSAHAIARRATAPAWSRDGRKIAFLRKDGAWICNWDGSAAHRVWRGHASSLSWHPSGLRLALSAQLNSGEAILNLNLKTGISAVFAGLSAWDTGTGFTFSGNAAAEWSADGRSLAFSRNGDVWLAIAYGQPGERRGWDVYRLVAAANFDAPTYRASRENEEAYRFSWSRDGKRLAYAVRRKGGSGNANVTVLHLTSDGTIARIEPIQPDSSVFDPAFASDGITLTLTRHDEERQDFDLVLAGKRAFHDVSWPTWRPSSG